jgi:uncharacterized protein
MGIPKKLKNLVAHVDGESYIGQVVEFEEPGLALATEEYRGAGMIGPIMIDLGLQAMQATLKMGGHTASLIRKFGITQVDGVRVRLTGAYQRDDTGEVETVECYIGGRFSEIGMGTAKPGDDTEHDYTIPLAYYRRVVNGRVEIEIDMIAGTFIVDGIDRYAEINSALQS